PIFAVIFIKGQVTTTVKANTTYVQWTTFESETYPLSLPDGELMTPVYRDGEQVNETRKRLQGAYAKLPRGTRIKVLFGKDHCSFKVYFDNKKLSPHDKTLSQADSAHVYGNSNTGNGSVVREDVVISDAGQYFISGKDTENC